MDNKGAAKLERTVVVVTALSVEFGAVKAGLERCSQVVHKKGTIYEVGCFETPTLRWRVCLAEVGSGNSATAMETERAIAHFNPAYVFFVGIAGGVKDVEIGDVVVASKVCRYESGADGSEFRVRPDTQEPIYAIREKARALVRRSMESRGEGGPGYFLGAIAAGEKVVKSRQSATGKFLAANYNDVLAVEMEGAGFFEAAHANGEVPALLVRGISDLLDAKEQADAAGGQAKAAENAAGFLFAFLGELAVGQQPGVPEYVPLGGQSHSTAYELLRGSIVLKMLDPEGRRVSYKKHARLRVLVEKVQSYADDLSSDGRIEEVRAKPFEAEYVVAQGARYLVLSRYPTPLTAGQEVDREMTCEWVDAFRNDQEYFELGPPFAKESQELELVFPASRHCKDVVVIDGGANAPIESGIEVSKDVLDDGSQRVVVKITSPRQFGLSKIRVQWQW